MKILAKKTVIINANAACFLYPAIILWWAHVTEQPDNNSIIVFKKGTSQGLNTTIPLGGHIEPISIDGARLLWKNAQKNAKKNSISETINKITPYRNPFWTAPVWCPEKVASLVTSRHHENIVNNNNKNPLNSRYPPLLYACIYITPPRAHEKADIAAVTGQGLGSTKWKGWRCNCLAVFLKFKFVVVTIISLSLKSAFYSERFFIFFKSRIIWVKYLGLNQKKKKVNRPKKRNWVKDRRITNS